MTTPKASYTDIVHDIVRESPEPLSFDEILYRVNKRQRITTKNPTSTIRNAIGQSRLIVNTGNGYGWKYRVINGSVLRLPLSKHELNKRQLTYPEEVRDALCPAFFENQKRAERGPVRVRLPNGVVTELPLDHFVKTEWGTKGTPAFWEWFETLGAKPRDALVLRVLDGEAREYALEFEPRSARDEAAIAQRNAEIVQAALAQYRRSPSGVALWDTSSHLLALGLYKHSIPPDTLDEIWTEDIWAPELALKPVNREWVSEDDLKMEPLIESLCWHILPQQETRGRAKKAAIGRGEPVTFHIKPQSLYQLKVSLMDAQPAIWRELEVPGEIHLSELHAVLQIAMGWTNSHMHQFRVGERYYGLRDEETAADFPELIDESKVRLAEAVPTKTRFLYTYDFGDTWEHQIVVQEISKPKHAVQYPTCLGGARACPPEDVGGVWGYADFLKALRDAKHPQHDEYLEWVGGAFDANRCDVQFVNRTLVRFVQRLVTWSQR